MSQARRRKQCSSRASRKMPRSPRLAHKASVMHDTQKILLQMKHQSLLTLSRWVGKVWLSFLILGWHSLLILLSGSINLTPPPSYPPLPSPFRKTITLFNTWVYRRLSGTIRYRFGLNLGGREVNYRVHQVTAYDSRVLVNKISWGVLKKAWTDREGIG